MAIQSRDQAEVSPVRRFAPFLRPLIGLVVVAIGVIILADRNASTNLLASIYDAIGNTQAAAISSVASATSCSPSSCSPSWRSSSASAASGCSTSA